MMRYDRKRPVIGNYRVISALSLALMFFVYPSVDSAHADSVEKFLDHETGAPETYGVYKGWLFFARDGKLFRLKSVGDTPTEIPIPTPLVWDSFPNAEFAEFDNHFLLSFGGILFKLDEPDGELSEVDMLIPNPGGRYRPDAEPRITSPSSFAIFREHLYFAASEPVYGCDTSGEWMTYVYRISSVDSKPEYVNTSVEVCAWGVDLQATQHGLMIYEHASVSSRSPNSKEYASLHILKDPVARALGEPSPGAPPAPVASCGSQSNGPAAIFEDDVYFTGNTWARDALRRDSGIGPFNQDCTEPVYFMAPWQAEPFRYRIADGATDYFDLHQLTDSEKEEYMDWPLQSEIGSSRAKNYVVANGVLYFQAATNGDNNELFRKTKSCEFPEILNLNQNAPSQGLPIGEYLGRLWFSADTGSGKAIHYLDDDGYSAVPITADIAIPSRIPSNSYNEVLTGFTEFDGGVVFTANSSSGELGTYIARIDRSRPQPNESQPCGSGSPDGPDEPPQLNPRLTVNGVERSDRPGLITNSGQRLLLRCTLNASEADVFSRLRVSIWERSRLDGRRRLLRTCSADSESVSPVRCRVRVRARRGLTQYWCRVAGREDSGSTVVERDAAFVKGRQRN